ncbi:flocculation protein [Salix suchowensis]|uniref:VQ MOTIF-CONTAINING PROTEIN 11-LIKE n=1 Tax=Salix koriyanagi TaxID=2511006 RepID=A0A9Q0ZKQ7_9ROSI|nr:flocculation protein [Salix suchowensis]KAJ6738180.1 VQ MOTIF-CONTAINING PROTEIN 11-LIKE [Salix koriyanagi]
METSPRHQDNQNQQSLHPSPTSYSSSSSSNSNSSSTTTTPTANNVALNNNINHPPPFPSPKSISRSESTNPYPTTFVQADTSSFKHVVQMLTGSPKPATTTTTTPNTSQLDPLPKTHNIPPIKSIPKKNQSSGFKLYERRNSLKNLKLNPLNPIFAQPSPGFSPRKPEILSPSILDFPSLVLSPVTPLIPDPFDRSGSANYTNCFSPINTTTNNNVVNAEAMDTDAEEKAIKEKGFYLHPSPGSTPRETEPRLLPLFPITSPRIPGSVNPSS